MGGWMKIKITGEMTIPALRQAIFEQTQQMEDRFAVRYVRDITIYVTPTNGFGDEVLCRDPLGTEIKTLHSGGPYRSAARDYEI
jgi:hypothetical protein|tara:strand:+ start:2446 stop:2697 length:252 start_codon:yes stop_codon:yes gene_type:complete